MNRKGFTLIELLAVIAILAILLIFALPQVIKLYNEFRENAFRIEAMNIYDVGIKERTKSVIENKELVSEYASNGEKLSIKVNKKIEYGIKFGSEPKEMKYFCVSNGEYRIRIDGSEANIITKDRIEKITVENTDEECVGQSSKNVAVKYFSAGNFNSAIVDVNNNLWFRGRNNSIVSTLNFIPFDSSQKFQSVSVGGSHSLGIDTSGKLWAWGYNYNGYLGDGTAIVRLTPVQITASNGSVTKFQSVSAGNGNTLAIDIEGNLWAWGSGILGDGTTTTRTSPVQITASNGSVTKFQSISVGDDYSIAIDTNNNAYYTGSQYIVNNKIKSNFSISKLELSRDRIYALSEENNLWAWGRNDFGQLGDGTTSNRVSPVQITASNGSVTKFQSISVAYSHSMAIDIEGNLWAWGNNNHGQLGDGTTNDKTSPVQITASNGSVTEFQSVSAGDFHSLAMDIEGNLWAWGMKMAN